MVTHSRVGFLLKQIDRMIRKGASAQAAQALKEIRLNRLSRQDRLSVAQLARRSGLSGLAVTILNPVVRVDGRSTSGTEPERLEYAVALALVGAEAEALAILEKIDATRAPEALLYRCFALFPQWRYLEAIEPLRRFLPVAPTEYQRLVGQVNLAAALIFANRYAEASDVLGPARENAENSESWLLLSNLLELSAQVDLNARRFAEAAEELEMAARLMKGVASADALYIEKWQLILALKKNGPESDTVRMLLEFRQRAERAESWETVRDCDFYLSQGLRDRALYIRLYHGTPYAEYRRKMAEEFKPDFEVPESSEWELGGGGASRTLDLRTGREDPGTASLKPGQLPHRLVECLASDSYRPFRTAELFARLFPDQYFHPESSVARVHQSVKRLRAWFDAQGVPLTIEEKGGHYRLVAQEPYSIRTYLASGPRASEEVQLGSLRKEFEDREFSAREAAAALGISKRSATRALKWGVEEKRLEVREAGPLTRYRFDKT
jgi:tetratricopeptide (TPR) repeat protein